MNNSKRYAAPAERLTWGIREAAQAISISPGMVRKLIAAGELKTVRAGRRVLIPDAELRSLLDRNMQVKP